MLYQTLVAVTILKMVAEAGFEPASPGYEPSKEPLLYPAIKNVRLVVGLEPTWLPVYVAVTNL